MAEGDIESQVDLGLNYCMGIGVKKITKKHSVDKK